MRIKRVNSQACLTIYMVDSLTVSRLHSVPFKLLAALIVIGCLLNYRSWLGAFYANGGRIHFLKAISEPSFQDISTPIYRVETDNAQLSQALELLERAQQLEYSSVVTYTMVQVYNFRGEWERTIQLLTEMYENPMIARRELLVSIMSTALINSGREAEVEVIWQSSPEARLSTLLLYDQAHELLREGRVEEAQETVRRADAIFTEPHGRKIPVYQALCINLRDGSHRVDAVYWCQRLTEANDRAGSYLLLGRAYLAVREYANAVKTLEVSVDKGGGSAAWNYLGNAYEELGRWDQAVEAYRESIRLDPDYIYARLNLADLYAYLDMPFEALVEYEALRGNYSQEILDQRIEQLDIGQER